MLAHRKTGRSSRIRPETDRVKYRKKFVRRPIYTTGDLAPLFRRNAQAVADLIDLSPIPHRRGATRLSHRRVDDDALRAWLEAHPGRAHRLSLYLAAPIEVACAEGERH